MRTSAARIGQTAGCTFESICVHGRWSGDELQNRYLAPESLTTIRTLAAYSKDGGTSWNKQQLVEPPADLCKLVFPKDAPELKRKYPHLTIREHTLFDTDSWREWDVQWTSATQSAVCPSILQAASVNPEVRGAIGALQVELAASRRENTRNTDQITQITACLHQLTLKMDGLHQMILPRLERVDAQSNDHALILNAVTSMSQKLHQITSPVVPQESHRLPTSQAGQSSILPRTSTQPVTQSSSHPLSQNLSQHQHQSRAAPGTASATTTT
ncbi:hypothetical protein DFS34DRAFT_672467 [Phlyctochytrium arcticum]|nr:hypothetical protein DFS34DRAFT_672467 [Phlyctochytrium arcticum]